MSTIPPTPSVPPLWRQDPTAPGSLTRPAGLRRWWIFFLLSCILALAGVLLGLLGWIRPVPRPYLMPLWVSTYQSRRIAFLPWGAQDLRALVRGDYFSRIIEAPFDSQDRRSIAETLAHLGRRVASDSVVVYLSARARVGPHGEVALLPADADPTDPATWMNLRDVLEALRDSPARGKLLVLDLMRMPVGPATAALDDDVAARVPGDLQAVDDPRRLTLCACSPGQFSLTSEELGRSVFSYYFEEGLRGWTELDQPGLSREGQVRVKDLASFVRRRVDRWARLNRGVRQEPILYGSGDDFPLLALKHDRMQPRPPMPPPATYPGWLEAGWSVRDRWRAKGSDWVAPLAFRHMEMSLLAAESEWRGGIDPAQIQQARMADLPIYEDALARVRATPRPRPSSLGMAAAGGWTPDPSVFAALVDLLAKRTAPAKPGAADPVAAFVETTRAASALDLAGAVFDAAGTVEPTPETILFLDGLLAGSQGEPLFVETLFLRRLADFARSSGAGGWPTETVRRALKVTASGERANNRPATLAWLRRSLDEAARSRHDAEVILFARRFAPIEEADRLERLAEARYAEILDQQGVILEARRQWGEALLFLPSSSDDPEPSHSGEDRWQEAVRDAIALGQALGLPDELINQRSPLPVDEVPRRVEPLRALTETLRRHLDELRTPFSDAAITALLAESRTPRAGPATYRAIAAVLRNPLPSAKHRVALWRASQDLASRLLKETLKLDRSRIDPDTLPAAGPDLARPGRSHPRAHRARRLIALLKLAGMGESEESRSLDDQLATAQARRDDPAAWWTLETGLRAAWDRQFTRFLPPSSDPASRNQLGPLVAPSWSPAYRDSALRGAVIAFRIREERALWAWLADRYEYEAADLGGSPFFATSARALRTLSGTVVRPGSVSPWTSPAPVASLSAEKPATSQSLPIRDDPGSGGADPLEIDVLLADPVWLRVGPASTELRRRGPTDGFVASYGLAPSTSPLRVVPLRIELDAAAEQSDTARPLGFLVRARIDGRDFHQAVALSLEPGSHRMQVLLSADPNQPTDPRQDLGLRVIKDRQPYYLYLRNATDRAQDVLVELKIGDQVVSGDPVRRAVGPGAIGRVHFAPGSIKPDGPLPELSGPLQVVLRDAGDKTKVLGQVVVGVRIAPPVEYVRVSDVEYRPASPEGASNSRLSLGLRASGEVEGPPIVAQLVLPPDQIPGFLGVGDGTFRGVLPTDGKPLVLFARGLRRVPGSGGNGTFYVQVDSYPRGLVFRATFAQEGQPSRPVEDTRPTLRLRAARSTPATSTFPIVAEVDNPESGSSLEIALGRSRGGPFEPEEVRTFPTAQRRRIGFSPGGPDGALVFEAACDDWSTTLDLSGVQGPRILRARVLDAGGSEVRAVSQPLLIDDNAPVGSTFVSIPAQARRGSKLPVRVTAGATESGIGQVLFFLGKPPAGGAALPATVPTIPGNPEPDGVTWSAVLTLPDVKGPTDLGAEFVSGAGRVSFATATVELLDTDPITPGRIVGTVMEGPRPQPGLVVLLRDAKLKEKPRNDAEIIRATTDPDGTFHFDGLAPGSYRLTTRKDASLTRADATVVVTPGAATSVTLELFR